MQNTQLLKQIEDLQENAALIKVCKVFPRLVAILLLVDEQMEDVHQELSWEETEIETELHVETQFALERSYREVNNE